MGKTNHLAAIASSIGIVIAIFTFGQTYRIGSARTAKSYLEFLQSVVFRGLLLPDAGVTFHPRYGSNSDQLPEAWKSTFEFMPEGVYELWCHPGFLQAGFSESDSLSERREQEITILLDPQLRDIAARRQLRLINFSQL